jgi:hypothetical protein
LDGFFCTFFDSESGRDVPPQNFVAVFLHPPGVRGPKIADLAISSGASGTVSGKVKLDRKQLALFHKGGLYVEIDSAAAPEGDPWGWALPFQD